MRAELVLGYGEQVNHKRVARLMREAGLQDVSRRRRRKNLVGGPTAEDLVNRQFSVDAPDFLWLTDITDQPTRHGKLYCAVVMDAYSRHTPR
ncbi:transposase InsO family protein [Amycolatopsis thermophila]|uniref:Transposase InsO family protein n=1 Tax=Amycolatopsis thermophila TaxID=206084 RepID=A0ABU0F631_9PSEU|nr:transposase InsO family protein [Amycolatopsis thermophila]